MKISKYFMVAAASIMMFGCAKNDENNGPHFDGPIALSLKIVDPSAASKAAVPPTAQGVQLQYDNVEVKLNATSGDKVNEWVSIPEDELAEYTFWNVEGPTSIEVRINGGAASYSELTNLENLRPENMAVYGVATADAFTRTGVEMHEDKQYDVYKATVEVKIPVARLEISGITHLDGGEACEYSALKLDQLDILHVANATEYPYTTATGDELLSELIGVDFLTTATTPADGNVYAFNICAGKPVLRFNFTGTTKDGAVTEQARYAVVKTINGNADYSFVPGNVYQITKVEIADEDITSDPTGNTLVAVNVEVHVQPWTIVETTVDF